MWNDAARVLGLLLLVAALSAVAPEARLAKPSDPDPVFDRSILGYDWKRDGTVAYDYIGEALPAELAEGEILSRRTPASYTRYLGTDESGAPLYELTAYGQDAFVEVGPAWHHIERATTTRARFAAASAEYRQGIFSLPRAHADSIAPFSTSADGTLYFTAFGNFEESVTSLADCSLGLYINGTLGDDFTSATAAVMAQYNSSAFGNCEVDRAYLPFDTSALGSGASITAATLSVYVTSKTNGVNDGGDLISVVEGSSAYSLFGAVPASSIDIGSLTTSAYNVFTLDATGRGWIDKTGTTELGLREDHDINGDISANASGNFIILSMSEQTGTSQDPYLTVTYTPAPAPSRVVRISEGFRLRIIEGTVRVFEQ